MTELIKSNNTQVILNLQAQLVEAELKIQNMHEALGWMVTIHDDEEARMYDGGTTRARVRALIRESTSTTHLDQYVASAVLAEREACANLCRHLEFMDFHDGHTCSKYILERK